MCQWRPLWRPVISIISNLKQSHLTDYYMYMLQFTNQILSNLIIELNRSFCVKPSMSQCTIHQAHNITQSINQQTMKQSDLYCYYCTLFHSSCIQRNGYISRFHIENK